MIREAVLADVPQLVELGVRFRASTGYAAFLAENQDQMRQTATSLIEQADGVVFVADEGGRLIGMFGCLLFDHHISGAKTCGEVFWFMHPEARGTGVRLLKFAEVWARSRKATQMMVTAPIGTKVGAIYERLGFHAWEIGYQKDLAA